MCDIAYFVEKCVKVLVFAFLCVYICISKFFDLPNAMRSSDYALMRLI